jgi:LPS export ABC transporter protein LptC
MQQVNKRRQKGWNRAFWLLLLAFGTFGCKKDLHDPDQELKYDGPMMTTVDVVTLYSDSARIKMKLEGPLEQKFQGGDILYPEGLFVTFYEDDGQVTTTLKANSGKYDQVKDAYLATGNVIVHNLEKKQTLHTEELNWDKVKQIVHTDKLVRIETPEEILTGEGLTANQDFSRYKILKPTGFFPINE